jgi:hypothetical protein
MKNSRKTQYRIGVPLWTKHGEAVLTLDLRLEGLDGLDPITYGSLRVLEKNLRALAHELLCHLERRPSGPSPAKTGSEFTAEL